MNPGDNKDRGQSLARARVSYGALDPVDSVATPPNSDTTGQADLQAPVAPAQKGEPPKPAVRQRILKKAAESSGQDVNKTPSDGRDNQAFEFSKGKDDENLTQAPSQAEVKQGALQSRLIGSHGRSSLLADGIATNGKLGAILPMPTQPISPPEAQQRPYPKKVLFIIANEFCERFSYYGLRGVLVLYFKSVLGFSDSNSTVSYHVFATLCYLTPILGAVLGDSVWGKFKTILYLSIVYLLGEIILLSSAIFWNLEGFTVVLTILGLLLISIGTGGIKPCVSALGGDQFLPSETERRESFFSLFYGAINLGALISLFLMPMFRSRYQCFGRSDCYPFAFGLPTVLMFISIVFFLLAAKHYVLVPLPKENVIWAFCQCSWLALKRKLAGYKLTHVSTNRIGHTLSASASTLNDNLSLASETAVAPTVGTKPVHVKAKEFDSDARQVSPVMKYIDDEQQSIGKEPSKVVTSKPVVKGSKLELDPDSVDQSHWLYLSSDRFSTKSIEEFRSVWRVILLFAPTPVYWCLFDQQSSLWTLQATRMDGKISQNFTLEPDQMTVANPILLLLSIPLMQLLVYPSFKKCNLLTSPVSKMIAGGLLAALTFIASAWIELQIQQHQPMQVPKQGYANLLLVNGLPDCSIVEPTVAYAPIPSQLLPLSAINGTDSTTIATSNSSSVATLHLMQQQFVPLDFNRIEPLKANRLDLLSADARNNSNAYQFKFRLSNNMVAASRSSESAFAGCPFNLTRDNEFVVGPLDNQAVRLLYVEQGNGRLTYKLFNDTLELPGAGMARVRLLFEFFGSIVQAEKRQFSLVRLSSTPEENARPHPELKFSLTQRSGQVMMSNYIDVTVPSRGDLFALQTNDSLLSGSGNFTFRLDSGTRNLILLQQTSANQATARLELLQGNDYRISILYQFIPYLMISISEVMFSITEMELAYSMAPETMKSVVLSLISMTVAVGNILTVVVESIHPFENVVYDFLFYASLMFLDICIFALIGYYHFPRHQHDAKARIKQRSARSNNSATKQSS